MYASALMKQLNCMQHILTVTAVVATTSTTAEDPGTLFLLVYGLIVQSPLKFQLSTSSLVTLYLV
jgi:hypothetical protein